MTLHEFRQWRDEFQLRFPSIATKFLNDERSVHAWFQVLADVDLPAALSATVRLHSGDLALPGDWAMIPATIRTAAAPVAPSPALDRLRSIHEQTKQRRQEARPAADRTPGKLTHREAFLRMLEADASEHDSILEMI